MVSLGADLTQVRQRVIQSLSGNQADGPEAGRGDGPYRSRAAAGRQPTARTVRAQPD